MTAITPISGPRPFWILVVLLLFTAVKIPALSVPLFWDEVGVYGAAGLYMHDHAISMLPAALPPELSRGHPLLYTCIQAIWFSLFGDTVLGGHIGNLCISLVLLYSVWFIMHKRVSARAALIAVCLIAIQPIFFAQSVMILPEVLLTLFMLWALFCWIEQRYLGFAIFATLAILTKETAVIIPAVAFAHLILVRELRSAITWRILLALLFPWLMFGVFLLVQKLQNGWYFFPYHGENIKLHLPLILDLLEKYCRFLFIEQGRILLTVVAALAIVYNLVIKQYRINKFLLLLFLLCAASVAINCISFYLDRYVLFVLIAAVLLVTALIDQLIVRHRASILIVPSALITGAFFMYGNPLEERNPELPNEDYFTYDSDMLYVAYATDMRQMIQEELDAVDTVQALYANWPLTSALMDTRYGYTTKTYGKDFYMANSWQREIKLPDASTIPVAQVLIADPGAYNYVIPDDGSWTRSKVLSGTNHFFAQYRPSTPQTGN